MAPEPLLDEPEEVFVSPEEPNRDVDEMCNRQYAMMWTPQEIDMAEDRKQFNDEAFISKNDRHFIKHVLAFFSTGDGIVMENLASRFMNDVKMTEVKEFYAFQLGMEGIHAKTYTMMLTSLIPDTEERKTLRQAIFEMPVVAAKAEWALNWMDSERPFGERLVAFSAVEGIFFSGSFCAIYWLKKRGLMPGLCFSNELISRDEGLHCKFACLLFVKLLRNKPSQETVHEIIRSAVDIEKAFVTQALSVGLIGMNAHLMTQYIEYIADFHLQQLGFEKMYYTENPFEWMELISLQGKTNFFEKRVSEYSKAGVMSSSSSSGGSNASPLAGSRIFSVEEDF